VESLGGELGEEGVDGGGAQGRLGVEVTPGDQDEAAEGGSGVGENQVG